MIPELKAELVTARNCVEHYAYLCFTTGENLYKDLCDFAVKTKEEHQAVLTQIERTLLV